MLTKIYFLEGLLLKPGPGPWKTSDLGKHGINMGFGNMADFRVMFYKAKAQCNLLLKSSQISKQIF